MGVLVLNAGSSSLKLRLFNADLKQTVFRATADIAREKRCARLTTAVDGKEEQSEVDWPDYKAGAKAVLDRAGNSEIKTIGHRIVHGGAKFRQATLITPEILSSIQEFSHLAPLHNPPALAAIEAARECYPDVPHVAMFDTAFFADLPPEAYIYPLPYQWYENWGIRRFGFHGISHAYCAMRSPELLAEKSQRLIVCHLGSGCSASAIVDGKPVAHTMGFTPLEGLMMATRAGSIDPGILLHVQNEHHVTVNDLEKILHYQSGLAGVSGISGDYREVTQAAEAGNSRARLALNIYASRIRSSIGALATAAGGLDALVFTAGVGENRPELRTAVCQPLGFLGIELDDDKNFSCNGEADIASADSQVRVLVLRTNEEWMIAREAVRLSTKC